MARQLVESLAVDEFEPEKYHDEYREQLLDLIERKAAGEEIVAEPESEAPAKVLDLVAALEASLAKAGRPRTATRADRSRPQSMRRREDDATTTPKRRRAKRGAKKAAKAPRPRRRDARRRQRPTRYEATPARLGAAGCSSWSQPHSPQIMAAAPVVGDEPGARLPAAGTEVAGRPVVS